ncbi:MAG: isopenicillin N synthase family oxygenase [Acidimicrobiia bacterium]|nr:isopenicillin N synthase family oxygenase [Acidimicrobiia bacterium]
MSAAGARQASFTEIPAVDLGRWRQGDEAAQARFAADVVDICHHVGFFTLVGHGVPDGFVARHFAALEAFFALPEATKARIDKRLSPHFRGWERVGSELTDNRVDHREQLDVSTENPVRGLDAEPAYLRLDGPNQWLDEDVLAGFRATVVEFFDRMGALADELLAVLSVGLGLARDHLATVFGARPLSLAKLISYPPTPPGECGVNAHHDAGFLTVLLQHGVGGLQALNPEGRWVDVEPTPGAFVINLGEMLQEMSGNYVVATTHRVVASEPRFSSAYFHGPDLTTRLDPLPLEPRFAAAVAASPRHRDAGFMAKRDELLAGCSGTASSGAGVYGAQLWNYYVRSYPANVARHHPDVAG